MASICHFIYLLFHQVIILSTYHCINLSFQQLIHIISSISHCINVAFHQLFMTSTCHCINVTIHQLTMASTCHFINLSFHQLLISSFSHCINLTSHQLTISITSILSTYHFINSLFLQFIFWPTINFLFHQLHFTQEI